MSLDDPRPVLVRALDQVEILLTSTDRAWRAEPTPCSEFTVDQLAGHLIGVAHRVAVILRGQPAMSVPSQVDSSAWADDWESARAELNPLIELADLARPVDVPWGTVPTAAALAMYAGEFAVHAWDLAAATGRAGEVDQTLAADALPSTMAKIPAEGRGQHVPFGPLVAVADDAPPYDRLVAWTGRDPAWTPAR